LNTWRRISRASSLLYKVKRMSTTTKCRRQIAITSNCRKSNGRWSPVAWAQDSENSKAWCSVPKCELNHSSSLRQDPSGISILSGLFASTLARTSGVPPKFLSLVDSQRVWTERPKKQGKKNLIK
jgi:hypothetical protein